MITSESTGCDPYMGLAVSATQRHLQGLGATSRAGLPEEVKRIQQSVWGEEERE